MISFEAGRSVAAMYGWIALLLLGFSVTNGDIFESGNDTSYMYQMSKLEKKLSANYSRDTRPVKDMDTKINVKIALHVQHLEVDEVQQTMTVHGYLSLKWKDEYMTWNPVEWSQQTKLHVPLWQIWKPDLNVYNSASGKDDWHISYQYPAWVKNTGEVTVFPPVTFRVSCAFDFAPFPNDFQRCPVILGSFKYPYEKLDMDHWSTEVNFFMAWNASKYHVAGWKIVNSSTEKMFYGPKGSQKKPTPSRVNWIEMMFWISLRRHAPYFSVTFLIPAVVTSIFTVFSFMMDTPKLQLYVLVLCMIAQGIFLRTLMQKLPPATGALPRVVHFYGFHLSMTFIGIILVLIFAALLNRGDPVPNWLDRIYNLTNFINPEQWSFVKKAGGGPGHNKFENEPEDVNQEEVDQDQENRETATEPPVTADKSGTKWLHIVDSLSRWSFLAYSLAYSLAMLALLT